jgi:cytochrome bd ubiquinol oxidase subunit II
MFGSLSHLELQQYWWIIISLLGGFLVFGMFVQGGQTLLYTLGKSKMEKTILINSLGRKLEVTFTTLVTFGGAFFASFPLFYTTSFGGAYWVWMAILFCFVIQAIAYEFRSKPNNIFGPKTFEAFLLINGFVGTLLVGTAVGTFFNGGNFFVNEYNQSSWKSQWYGLEAVLNFHNVALGISIFALARINAILYFHQNIENPSIIERSKSLLWRNTGIFLIAFLYWFIRLLFIDGFAYDQESLIVFKEKYKYLNNLIQMPFNTVILTSGVVLVLFGIIKALINYFPSAVWYTGIGTVLTVFSLFILSGFNGTCFYPSNFDTQSSLNIQNASSSHFTLTAMSYASLMVPFVFGYIFFAWRSINNKKMDEAELESESHVF